MNVEKVCGRSDDDTTVFCGWGGGLSTLSVWHVKVTYFGWQRSGAAAEGGRERGGRDLEERHLLRQQT